MNIGHWVGEGVQLIVQPICTYIFKAPATCAGVAVVAHEITEAFVDNGLRVGAVGILDGTAFDEIDSYRLGTQIAGLVAIKLCMGPVGLLLDTAVSLPATYAIGLGYDLLTGNEHDHAAHTPGESHHHAE